MTNKTSNVLTLLVFILLAALGGLTVHYGMQWGPWAYNDSAAYLSAARNLALGNGPVILHSSGKISPVLEFPPLYPFLLSLFGITKFDPNSVIRILKSVLFATTVFVFTLTIYKNTGKIISALIAGGVFTSTQLMLFIYTSAMSEPFFIFLLVSILFTLNEYFSRKTFKSFVLLTAFSALLPLARIAGILFVGGFGAMILLFAPLSDLKHRLRKTLVYFFFAFLPSLIWFVIRYFAYGKVGGKRFELSYLNMQTFGISARKIINVLSGWIPYWDVYTSTIFRSGIALLLILVSSVIILPLIDFFRNSTERIKPSGKMIITTLSLGMGYLFFIAVIHVISIPQIDVIDRMLVPIIPLGIMLLIISLDTIWIKFGKSYILMIGILFASLLLIRFNILTGKTFIENMHENGLGFNARNLQESGIISELKEISVKHVTASNSAGFVLYHTNVYPYQIDQFPNHPFGTGESYGEKDFRESNGRLILLYSDFNNYYGDQAPELLNTITKSLIIEYEDDEGAIYSYP